MNKKRVNCGIDSKSRYSLVNVVEDVEDTFLWARDIDNSRPMADRVVSVLFVQFAHTFALVPGSGSANVEIGQSQRIYSKCTCIPCIKWIMVVVVIIKYGYLYSRLLVGPIDCCDWNIVAIVRWQIFLLAPFYQRTWPVNLELVSRAVKFLLAILAYCVRPWSCTRMWHIDKYRLPVTICIVYVVCLHISMHWSSHIELCVQWLMISDYYHYDVVWNAHRYR